MLGAWLKSQVLGQKSWCLVLGQIAGAWCLVESQGWQLAVGSCQGIAGGWFAAKFSRVFSEASDLSGIASDLGEDSSYFNSIHQIELQQPLGYATNCSQTNYSSFREFEIISPTLRPRVEQWCQ